MKQLIVLLIMCLPLFASAQVRPSKSGINFECGLSWQQIKAKAKAENKYVFLDCYATWCGPCRIMDGEVYSNDKVGDFIDGHFISIKVQFDTSKTDNEFVKSWYGDAHAIINQYKVSEFPTYLFFSPDGKIVHRASGATSDSNFISIASHALDPNRQYYTRLDKYRLGKTKYSDMPKLALLSKSNGDDAISIQIAKNYLHNFLDKQNSKKFMKGINDDFIKAFLYDNLTSRDPVFKWIYRHSTEVDVALNFSGFSETVINHVIKMEEIDSRLWPNNIATNSNPDWQKISALIENKYNKAYADRNILDAKLKWYNQKKDWPEITKYTIQKIERYGLDTAGLGWLFINNTLYEVIFKHSTNLDEINKAAKWMQLIVDLRPNDAEDIDTYANLLYKSGKTQEALVWEEKASQLKPKDESILCSLMKMKKGEPTWLISLSTK